MARSVTLAGISQIDGAASISETEENDDSCDSSLDEDRINMRIMNIPNCARFLLTKALDPKVDYLLDAFQSLKLHFACITETWFHGGKDLSVRLNNVEGVSGIRFVHKSRDGRTKSRGGGVAVAFDTATCNFKKRQLKHLTKGHEVVCVIGRIGKIGKTVAILTVYVPPSMKAGEFATMNEALAAEIAAIKTEHKDPCVVVGGDFNHGNILEGLCKVDNFSPVQTGPTRGDNTIDIIYTNVGNQVCDDHTLPPLQATSSASSDHRLNSMTRRRTSGLLKCVALTPRQERMPLPRKCRAGTGLTFSELKGWMRRRKFYRRLLLRLPTSTFRLRESGRDLMSRHGSPNI